MGVPRSPRLTRTQTLRRTKQQIGWDLRRPESDPISPRFRAQRAAMQQGGPNPSHRRARRAAVSTRPTRVVRRRVDGHEDHLASEHASRDGSDSLATFISRFSAPAWAFSLRETGARSAGKTAALPPSLERRRDRSAHACAIPAKAARSTVTRRAARCSRVGSESARRASHRR